MQRIAFILLIAIAAISCRKDIAPEPCTNPLDPNCVNYHPCNGVQPVTADFEMWYGSYLPLANGTWIEEDSVFPPGYILFKAKLNGAQYRWILGRDTEYVQQDFRLFSSRYIGDTSIYGTYYNTLTVWKTPKTACYPNDQPTAQLTRSITIKRPSQLLTTGTFKVLYDGDMDSTIIQIRPWILTSMGTIDYQGESEGSRYFVGFKGLRKDTLLMGGSSSGYWYTNKKIILPNSEGGTLDKPRNGTITVDPDTYIIEGNYEIISPKPGTFKFKGRKLL